MIPFPFRQMPALPALQPETVLTLAVNTGKYSSGGRSILKADRVMDVLQTNEPTAWKARVTIGRTGAETDTFIPVHANCILIRRKRKRMTTTVIRGRSVPQIVWVRTVVSVAPTFAAEEWRLMAADPCAGTIPNQDE